MSGAKDEAREYLRKLRELSEKNSIPQECTKPELDETCAKSCRVFNLCLKSKLERDNEENEKDVQKEPKEKCNRKNIYEVYQKISEEEHIGLNLEVLHIEPCDHNFKKKKGVDMSSIFSVSPRIIKGFDQEVNSEVLFEVKEKICVQCGKITEKSIRRLYCAENEEVEGVNPRETE